MRYAPVALALLLLSTSALAVPNSQTTLPLHAIETGFGICDIGDPCLTGVTVNVAPGTQQAIYLLVRNYDDVAGVQTAFEWGAQWTFTFGLWDCQSNQVNGITPTDPGGPTAGTIASAFDCITGGTTAVIGRMHFNVATAPGSRGDTQTNCVRQVEPNFPFGNHVVSCTGEVDLIGEDSQGSVCTETGGYDACDPPATGTEAATWGSIKAQYHR